MAKMISRKDFLKGTAASALALTAFGGLSLRANAEESDINWDGEYDVVVMGMGTQGLKVPVGVVKDLEV